MVIHPAVAAINTTSLALAKVLSRVTMTELPVKNAAKRRAAQMRSSAHNRAKQRWEAR